MTRRDREAGGRRSSAEPDPGHVCLATGVALLLLGLIGVLARFGDLPLIDPDEGRNAGVAVEMARAGEWAVPMLHGMPYLDKPVLLFAALRAAIGLFGETELAARLPLLLAGLMTLFFTHRLARTLFDRDVAWLSVGALAVSPLFIAFSRYVIFDGLLTACVLFAWWMGERGRRGAPLGHVAAWGGIGLAVLAKGPIGLLLGLVGLLVLHLAQGSRRTASLFPPLGLALFALVVGPWIAQVERTQPGFLRYALVTESAERFLTPAMKRSGPFWYYLPVLFVGFLPWSALLLARLRHQWRDGTDRGALRALALTAALVVLFFSLSRSKLPGYVLPILPLLAILVGHDLRTLLRDPRARRADSLLIAAPWLVLGVASGAAVLLEAPLARWLRLPATMIEPTLQLFGAVALIAFAPAAFALIVAGRGRRGVSVAACGAVMPMLLLLGLPFADAYAETNSARALAARIRVVAPRPLERVCHQCYPPGLSFYLAGEFVVATADGRELTSNYLRRNFPTLPKDSGVIGLTEFDRGLASGVFAAVISRRDEAPSTGYRLDGRFGRFRLWVRERTGS
ncbi:MAG: glycosyltransferase family 39 protein [Candidatus Eisenbacteria bacterium]|nr:glycosyltransferase family 39 protein [Candidatus Eisenbacteria bacterium]